MVNEGIWKLEIKIPDDSLKAIGIAFLDNFGVSAIEENDHGLIVYNPKLEYLEGVKNYLVEELEFIDFSNVSILEIENRNWNKEWESSFEPIVIGDFCAIRASHHTQKFHTEHIITINPELAFGTGHHETTYQMIQMMKDLDFNGKKVFDYGCGTCILAILARQLGASVVDAIDNDVHAVKCSEDSLLLNNIELVNVSLSNLENYGGHDYDIVLANINRNVLLESSELLSLNQSKNGLLLLSGILKKDEELITSTYTHSNYSLVKTSEKGNWSCLLFQLD